MHVCFDQVVHGDAGVRDGSMHEFMRFVKRQVDFLMHRRPESDHTYWCKHACHSLAGSSLAGLDRRVAVICFVLGSVLHIMASIHRRCFFLYCEYSWL